MTALLGFFLVRSGVISSVHSFAADPTRGTAMLIIIFIVASVAMISFGKKYTEMKFVTEDQIFTVSREAAILIQVVLLLAMAATVLLGIFYPMMLEVFAKKRISVGEPYFNAVFVPIALAMSALMIFIPVVKWQREFLRNVIKKSGLSFIVACIIAMYVEVKYPQDVSFGIIAGVVIFSWLIILAAEVILRKLITKDKISKGFVAMIISHAAFGILGLAITLNAAFQKDTQLVMKMKDKKEFEGISLELSATEIDKGKNFLSQKADFVVNGDVTVTPENRIYFPDLTKTHEADIDGGLLRDVYVVMGQTEQVEGKENEYLFPTRIYIKPYMFFIWFSVLMIAFGGFIALLPKKK
jgi:cytochrome c-type biogenesis protein CcmF